MKPEQAAHDAGMPEAPLEGTLDDPSFAIAGSRAQGVFDRAGIAAGALARFA